MTFKVCPEVKQTKTFPLSSLYLQLLLFTMMWETSNVALKVVLEAFIIERFQSYFLDSHCWGRNGGDIFQKSERMEKHDWGGPLSWSGNSSL